MPTLIKRLAGPRTCPIVVAQYKDEYRGVGHEEDLHWALVVITDRATLSGPSFQAYAQRRRRRSRSSKAKPRSHHPSMSTAAQRTTLRDASNTNALINTRTLCEGNGEGTVPETRTREPDADGECEYETQWYARHAPASLYDVCATVRTLCLGGVQVGAVRAADVGKLTEYLQSHPPAPTHAGWSSRDYVLELLELLRPFKMLREDLQSLPVRRNKCSARGRGRGMETETGKGTATVEVADLLPELREAGRVTQESIFNEEFRPFVKYHS